MAVKPTTLALARAQQSTEEARFLQWLSANAVDTSKLIWPVRNALGGRTAYAAATVCSGDALLQVPEALMMTPSKALACELGPYALEADLRGDALLATFVLWELRKGDDSFWAPYLQILPPSGSTICDWSVLELEELCDQELVERMAARRRFVSDMHERIFTRNLAVKHPTIFGKDEWFGLSAFTFAWNVIQARAFGRKLRETALVPWADCLNHGEPDLAGYELIGDTFRLFSTRGVAAGAEALNTYGRHVPNTKLLMDYGFALRDNPRDTLRLAICLDFDQRAIDRKRQLLEKWDIPHFAYLTLALRADVFEAPANANALALLRLDKADDDQLNTFETDGGHASACSWKAHNIYTDITSLQALAVRFKQDLLPLVNVPLNRQDEKLLSALEEQLPPSLSGGRDPARLLFALRYRTTRSRIVARNYARILDAIAGATAVSQSQPDEDKTTASTSPLVARQIRCSSSM